MANGRINKEDVIDPALQKEIENITASLKKMADSLGVVVVETSKLNASNKEGVSSTQQRKKANDDLSKSEQLIAQYNEKIVKTYETLSEKEKEILILKEKAAQASSKLTNAIKNEVNASENAIKAAEKAAKESERAAMVKEKALQREILAQQKAAEKAEQKAEKEARAAEKAAEKEKKLQDRLEKESGILGSLIKKQQELENARLKATDKTSLAKINKDIEANQKAMQEAKGTTAGWGTALASFQAKWNAIGALMAGVVFKGIDMVTNALKDGVKAVVEFDQKSRELQTITGASAIGMIQMQAAAVKMSLGFGESGIKVNQSASDILEAFKLVGSAKPELLTNAKALETVTEQALILAKAAGTDTATAVTSLTKIMNQFGAPAEQAGRYINVLAAGAKYGAGEIPYLSDAVGRVGVVSKTANQPIEELAATMELFAEKGLESEKAGTAYRNVLIKSMNDQANYKDGVFSTQLMMENLGKVSTDTTLLTKKFGLENVVVAQTLAQGTDRIKELTKQMTGTNTAYEQAENNTKTLADSWQYLKQGLSAIVLGIAGSAGPLKSIIDLFGKWAAAIGMAFQTPLS